MTGRRLLGWLRRRDGSPRVVFPLRTWLTFTHLAVFVLPVVVLVASGALARDLRNQTRWDLEHQAALLSMVAVEMVTHARERDPDATLVDVGAALTERLREAKAATLSGIQVVDTDGRVLASSAVEPVLGEDLSGDDEVAAALSGQVYSVVRPRLPTRAPLGSASRRAGVRLFVARPVTLEGEILGAMVLSRTPREEIQALYQMAPGALLVGASIALLATLGVGFLFGFLLTRSLAVVADTTSQIADGELTRLDGLDGAAESHVQDVALLATSVHAMALRLRARLSYISEFASNVSHEFKTPLATLRGTVELLSEDHGSMPDAQRERFLANAHEELQRLDRLVEGLLVLARAEEGGERREIALDALIGRVVSRYSEVEHTGTAGQVFADTAQLEAVVDNLLVNARRHGAPPIRVVGLRTSEGVGFEVRDAGPGIAEAHRDQVFDRFFTTRRDAGGTGLGLALVRAIVEAHGGRVQLDSGAGQTCFRVVLPPHDGERR